MLKQCEVQDILFYKDEANPFFQLNVLLRYMIKIEYPNIKPSIKNENGKEFIFCMVRKRWFTITPEEWVRQNFLLYLSNILGYPIATIAVEKQLIVGELKKRFDIIVYKNLQPFAIVECKEMNVPLSESTLRQVLQYNSHVQAPLVIVTNGNFCKAFEKTENCFYEIFELPHFVIG